MLFLNEIVDTQGLVPVDRVDLAFNVHQGVVVRVGAVHKVENFSERRYTRAWIRELKS